MINEEKSLLNIKMDDVNNEYPKLPYDFRLMIAIDRRIEFIKSDSVIPFAYAVEMNAAEKYRKEVISRIEKKYFGQTGPKNVG